MKTFLKVWLSIGLIAIVFGIGIVFIAFLTEPKWKDIETYSFKETYDGIENIDIEIGFGDVKIIEGDTFSIDAKHLLNDEFDSYVSDKTWIIDEKYDRGFNIFGGHFSLRNIIFWEDSFAPRITITVPKDFNAEQFSLEVGAGNVEVEKIIAEEGEFIVGVGRLYIEDLTIFGESTYSVGAGEMELDQVVIRDITIDGGMGYVSVDGTVTGNNNISAGVGSIRMDLKGEPEDYSYEITAGIGSVSVDREKYNGVVDKRVNNKSAENFLNLECGIGDINVDFH